jgi:hypothetical protein
MQISAFILICMVVEEKSFAGNLFRKQDENIFSCKVYAPNLSNMRALVASTGANTLLRTRKRAEFAPVSVKRASLSDRSAPSATAPVADATSGP